MRLGSQLAIVAMVCSIPQVQRVSVSAERVVLGATDSVSSQVERVFAEEDRLAAQRTQRSREYLSSLSDDELAKVYARATAPQQMPAGSGPLREAAALEKVEKDRQAVLAELLKWGTPLGQDDDKAFRAQHARLVDELAAMGPNAVPVISVRLGAAYRATGRGALAKESLLKMGPGVVEPLIPLIDSNDRALSDNAAEVLSEVADDSARDVLLHAADHESGGVRRSALVGLIRLGPEVVGDKELIAILMDHLEDSSCLSESVHGLERYGDETAIEPLRVIERFCPVRKGIKKGDWPYSARRAINAILKRAGKPFKEVSAQECAQRDSTYDELCQAAQCPNAAIRSSGITWLEQYRDDRTARFFLERLRLEKKPTLLQVIRSLGMLTLQPKGTSEPGLSADVMQAVFDCLVAVAQTDAFQETDQKAAAIDAARTVLFAACVRQIHLDGTGLYKAAILRSLSSDAQGVRDACYSACTAIATVYPPIGEGWLASEKQHVQEQLTPLLNSPDPPFRLIECLGFVGDRRLTPRLIELLGHSDPTIRRFAASALGQIGDLRALPTLKHLAETDPDQYENGVYGVREAALRAIRGIGKTGPVDPRSYIGNQNMD